MTPLQQFRQNPSKENRRALACHLQAEAQVTLRAHPVKTLPSWLSKKALVTEVDAALDRATEKLLHNTVTDDHLSPFVLRELELAIAPLFASAANDWLARRRGHSLAAGFLAKDGSLAHAVDDARHQTDPRDHIVARLAEIQANTPKKRDLLDLLLAGASVAMMRVETGCRGPDVVRALGLKPFPPRTA